MHAGGASRKPASEPRRHLQPPAAWGMPLRPGPRRCSDARRLGTPRRRDAHGRRAEQRFRSYFTLTAFLSKRYGEGTDITPWVYHGSDGREAFRVLRIDYRAPDGSKAKSYRPCHQGADGRWRLARPERQAAALQPPGHPRRAAGGRHRPPRRREMRRPRRGYRRVSRHHQRARSTSALAHGLVAAR